MKTKAQLLAELEAAVVDGSSGAKTTAAGLRLFLASLIDQIGDQGLSEGLPQPRVQVRRESGGAHIGGAGTLNTRNFVRLLFDAPLSPAVLALDPEIWLFTYNRRRRHWYDVYKSSWGHPSHLDGSRHPGAFWGGGTVYNAATEFFSSALRASLALERPYADVVIDSNSWFSNTIPAMALGKKGRVRRFRFALVVDAPADKPTPSGKLLGPLSDEIWLHSHGTENLCYFQVPMYNKETMS